MLLPPMDHDHHLLVSLPLPHQAIFSLVFGEFRNGDVHSSAETRRKLYAQGIFKEIGNIKVQAGFCMFLTARETPVDTLKRLKEHSQLDWICRAEQFISSTRLSRRLQLASRQFYLPTTCKSIPTSGPATNYTIHSGTCREQHTRRR